MHFDENCALWTVRTDTGTQVTAKWLFMGTGNLSRRIKPSLRGASRFNGPTYHTGEWPREGVDFTGQRVGIIGTGSSGVQAIPIIAEQAAHSTVFQRTANFCVPAHNGPIDPEVRRQVKAKYPAFRARSNAEMGGMQLHASSAKAAEASEECLNAGLSRSHRREDCARRSGWDGNTLLAIVALFS